MDIKNGETYALVIESNSERNLFVNAIIRFIKDLNYVNVFDFSPIKNITANIFFENSKIELESNINDISFLSSKLNLVNNFTISENVFSLNYPSKIFLPFVNWKKVKVESTRIIEKMGFDLDLSKRIFSLSDEEKKLVSIIKVFFNKPKFIIMNEATNDLSADSTAKFNRIINNYKAQGNSVLYITKSWEEALKVADRISVINDGELKGPLDSNQVKINPRQLLNFLGDYKYTEANKNHKLNSEEEEVLDAVFRAAEFLTSEYELKDVLLLLAKQISKIMNADGCSINLLDQNTNTIIDSLDFKMNENLEIELKKETIFKIVENNDVYYINRHDKEFSTIFKKNNKIKTLICVPIRIRSHVSGIIQIYYEDYYLYSEEEYRYLSAFARQAAIAIEDTRLMGRSALLQESHHRIKNNLQAIVNLISLQKRFNSSEDPKDINYILDNTISRVKSIAAVHDILSQERMGRSITNVKELINSIVKFINFGDKIEVKLDLADIFIPYSKASSIALIINELINNSIKHAFDFNSNGIINIVCGRMDTSLLLKVTDNGVGFPENFNSSDLDSLGITIINSIVAKEFCGELEFYNDKGAVVKIKLPIKNIFLGK